MGYNCINDFHRLQKKQQNKASYKAQFYLWAALFI